MFRSQGVGQAFRTGAGVKGQRELRVRRPGWKEGLLRLASTALQHLRGKLMPLKHPSDPTVVAGVAIALPDDPRQFAIGEGMCDRQLHEVLLDVTRQEFFDGGFPPRVGQVAAIDQSQEALTSKAAQVTPQPPIAETCRAAVLRERTLVLQDGANRLIACERLLLGGRVTGEEVSWKSADLSLWHGFLLPSPQRSTSSKSGGIHAYRDRQIGDKSPIPEFCRMIRPHPYRRSTDSPLQG